MRETGLISRSVMATLMEHVAGLQHLRQENDLRLAPLVIQVQRSSNKHILQIEHQRPMPTRLQRHVLVRARGRMIGRGHQEMQRGGQKNQGRVG